MIPNQISPLEKERVIMPNTDSKTYIVNDQPPKNGEIDALDFTPRAAVETLADIIQTGDTPLTIGVFGISIK